MADIAASVLARLKNKAAESGRSYYLANKFDFDGTILSEALRKTFTNREHGLRRSSLRRL